MPSKKVIGNSCFTGGCMSITRRAALRVSASRRSSGLRLAKHFTSILFEVIFVLPPETTAKPIKGFAINSKTDKRKRPYNAFFCTDLFKPL